MSKRRALIAGLLALVYPGLGHLYLRRWLRAIGWFVLAIATLALVLPESTIEAVRVGGLDAAIETSRTLPQRAVLSLLFVRGLNAIDAAIVGLDFLPGSRDESSGPTCPNCGRELDGDLDFCYWCTTRLEAPSESS